MHAPPRDLMLHYAPAGYVHAPGGMQWRACKRPQQMAAHDLAMLVWCGAARRWAWEKGVTPGSFIRAIGPWGPNIVHGYVSKRFSHHGEGGGRLTTIAIITIITLPQLPDHTRSYSCACCFCEAEGR